MSSSMTNWRHVKVSPHQGFKTPINEECSGHILSVELSNPVTVEYSLLASIFAQRYYIYMCVCVCVQSFPSGSVVKNPPSIQKPQVWSLSQEDPLEEGMASHSSILAWRIPWTEEPGRLQSMGSQRVGDNWSNLVYAHACTRARTHTHTHTHTHILFWKAGVFNLSHLATGTNYGVTFRNQWSFLTCIFISFIKNHPQSAQCSKILWHWSAKWETITVQVSKDC